MITAVVSGKAAPGVTTSTWALALTWPRPVVAVDADIAGGDMAAGLLAGRADLGRGLLSWVGATRRASTVDAARAVFEHAVLLPEAPQLFFLSGLHMPGQAAALESSSWARLAAVLRGLAASNGCDSVVDAGRLSDRSCWPLLASATRVLLTTGRSARSVHAARNAADLLVEQRGDLARVELLVVGDGPFAVSEISRELKLTVAGAMPADRDTASVLSDGAPVPLRGLRRTPLLRRAATISRHLCLLDEATRPSERREAVPGDTSQAVPS